MWIVVLSIYAQLCQPTPILTPNGFNNLQSKPPDACVLPQKFGVDTETKKKFLEDCKSLDRFATVPAPLVAEDQLLLGVHPQVCCPQYLQPSSICTPSDAWCPTYEEYQYEYGDEYGDEYEYGNPGEVDYLTEEVTIASQSCAAYAGYLENQKEFKGENATECVTLDRCPSFLESPTERIIFPCGFDEEASLMMVCCPPARVTDSTTPQIKPRYPQPTGEPRSVEDRTPEHCQKWKNNGACRRDKERYCLEEGCDVKLDQYVGGISMFTFMMSACMETCGWGKKGCVDEHVNCPAWARLGLCSYGNSYGFMAHTCRESCGVCGFLSPFNNETQEVGGASYTNLKDSNFDCGRYKTYCEIQGDCTSEDLSQFRKGPPKNVTFGGWGYENVTTDGCSTTLINDRFAISAAHCYKDFGQNTYGKRIKTRLNSDFEEEIEIKRTFTHPLYNYDQNYNDMIVLELGRRVYFDFDKYGHTPNCLDRGDKELAGKTATVQGSGKTETNTDLNYRALLETNVTLISNVECKKTLEYNQSESAYVDGEVKSALRYGITYGFICAKGIQYSKDELLEIGIESEKEIFSGSCKGDSGGPLFVNITDSNSVNRQTLTGIVSGGVGCGLNVPGWYTKVSTYLPWVNCIIEASRDPKNDQEMVEEKCNKVADCLVPKCISEEELFRTPDVPAEPEDSLFADYYTDYGNEDILDLRANDKFKIPVCISDPQETEAECLLGLGISS